VLVILVMSLRGIARFYTDFLWFEEIGFRSVWRGVLLSKTFLSISFTLVFFLLLFGNLAIADRLAPTFRPVGAEDEIVARYQEVIGPYAGRLRAGVAILFALIAGMGAGSEWQSWLLFRNSTPFGVKDPQFGKDISFYMFRLPFMKFVLDWFFVAFVLVLVLTVVGHYLNGGIRLQSALQRVTPAVKGHVSVLLGLIAITKAALYYLQTFELSFSRRGFVQGAGFTDVHAQLPALRLLTFIMAAAAILFLANIWRRGWALPVVAMASWAIVAITAGVVYPAVIQRVRVRPAENQRERPFIQRNIQATRAAMGLEGVTTTPFNYTAALTSADLQKSAETVRNIRLWDPDTLRETYRALQELRSFYQFADVDIDRYPIDGATRSVVLSVRGLNPHDVPGKSTWVNSHLQYTHGYGAVLSSANAVDSQGRPDLLLSNIPPVGKPELSADGSRIYFSENLPDFAVVNTKQPEIDYQGAGAPTTTQYTGQAGVRLSSPMRRFAFALRYGDPNILLSAQLTSNSRVVFNRDIRDRVRAAAPFLSYDSDPYPIIIEKRVFWVQDAYTTSSRYPYAQQADTSGLRAGAQLADDNANYIRNSVKIVIDAFNGATTFYQMDKDDPIVRSYAKAFPDLFTPGSAMPAEIRAHLRYPEDLFRTQANMFATYHVTSPDAFFASSDAWDIAQDPGTGRVSQTLRTTNDTTGVGSGASGAGANGVLNAAATATGGRLQRMEPTYLYLKLPGEETPSFLILQPFVPASRDDRQKNLTAFLIAHSDPGKYGKLTTFEMPRNEQVDGPLIVNNAIQSEPDISRELTQLNQQGSSALLGQVQVVPIENSLLYVRPLYVTSQQTPIPEVKRVIVVHNGRAVMRSTLRDALVVLFGDAPATLEEAQPGGATSTSPAGSGSTSGTTATPSGVAGVDDLLARAEAAFAAADTALKQGDLAAYQTNIKQSRDLIAEATRRLAAARAGSSATTSTSTSAPSA
jgi:uncharacterized membrane protein (UPF0182 family)